MPTGTVCFYHREGGFGVIRPDRAGADAFVHSSAVQASGLESLCAALRVTYVLRTDQRGQCCAHDLDRAADFLAAGLRAGAPAGPSPIAGPYRAKVIANGLRELDRFLNLLIDEARRVAGLPIFPDQRNTANKFTADDFQGRHSLADYERLRALGRSRECLFYCQGRVLRGDRADAERMTAGWPERPGTVAPLRRFALGSEISVSQQDLADVAAFYRRLAEEISAAVRTHQADI